MRGNRSGWDERIRRTGEGGSEEGTGMGEFERLCIKYVSTLNTKDKHKENEEVKEVGVL